VFSPRSLDVDVVLDLMIHDIDILLSLVDREPEEVRAAGISILRLKWIFANVRLQFPAAVWRTSPPAASPPIACANCACSSRTSTFGPI